MHLARPLGVTGWSYRRGKNDTVEASGLADLLRMRRLDEAWIAPPRDPRAARAGSPPRRARGVALQGLRAQVHAVLAKEGVRVPMSDRFGKAGMTLLADVALARADERRVASLVNLIEAYDYEVGSSAG